ncbi:MAG: ATP-binding protein [Actinomycetota bacterium]|nr:ATP-binding protein [Actinomycetota bacterium]
MHALIENAVTYSYDSSTVVVAATLAPARVGDLGGPRGAGARSSEHAATAAAGITRPAGADGAQEPDSREEHPAGTVSTQPAGTQPAGSEPAGTQPAGPQAASSEPTSPEPAGSVSTELGGSDPVSSQPAGPVSSEPAGSHPGGSVSTQPAGPVGANGERSSVHPPRDTVRLSVADRGVGIPARDLDRIFERFYRVDHGRSRETGGTGLGLSIVRHVASNHQGWVEVESREGEGSTFTLVLPLYTDRH